MIIDADGSIPKLRRVLGPISVACVGIGAAIGSGIFATPGEAAKYLRSPWIILVVWLVAGVITLLQTLVTAELATRLPKAGGEYQYLKEAYGEFAAFFFGWSFTVFIVGGGAGTIAALFGDFLAELMRLPQKWAPASLGCAAVIGVVIVNVLGIRTGAMTQNILTMLKTAALLVIAISAMLVSRRVIPLASAESIVVPGGSLVESFFLALLPVFWSYTGATDSAKMAEETKDARRALPLALCGSAILLTGVYVLYNYSLLCGASPVEMAGHSSVPALIFSKTGASFVGDLILATGALVCLGAVSSTILANVRVTFAMARDGLAPGVFGKMSAQQAPIASIILGGVLACSFVVNRKFGEILRIYFMASTVLFGLTYLSLIVFRVRDRRIGRSFPASAFKMPCGMVVAILLAALEAALAISIIASDIRQGHRDSLYTLLLLAGMAAGYIVWKRVVPQPSAGQSLG